MTFRLDSIRMGSVDAWQIARLLPLSIRRNLPYSYPVAAYPVTGYIIVVNGLLLGPVNSTGSYPVTAECSGPVLWKIKRGEVEGILGVFGLAEFAKIPHTLLCVLVIKSLLCCKVQLAGPPAYDSYLVDSASSHMLVSKIKPCMSKYKQLYSETANGSLNQLSFI